MREEGKGPARITTGSFSALEGRFAMADKRALKLIGIIFAALILMVISMAAAVVAGHAARSVNGDYLQVPDLHD
ncbi:hypothetical protein ACH79_17875 [Bradyrhizobium sp. CCBAU 051011]|nr:hypothetical protein ACH79_17875 [Bradyrhizobium sp. CCBAU 051011]